MRNLDMTLLTERALIAATLVTVPLEVGPVVAANLGLTGWWAAVGYALVVVFDLVWLGALAPAQRAMRQRDRVAFIASVAVALLGAGASVVAVARYGSLPFLALIPAVALAMHLLGKLTTERLADGATDEELRRAQLNDRNRRVTAAQGAESLAVTRRLAADAKVATLLAETAEHDALMTASADAYGRRMEVAARMEERLAGIERKRQESAAAFHARGPLLPELASMTVHDSMEALVAATDAPEALPFNVRPLAPTGFGFTAQRPAQRPVQDTASPQVAGTCATVAQDAADTASSQVAGTCAIGAQDGGPGVLSGSLVERNAARRTERAARLAAVRDEGLDADTIVARWGVAKRTAQQMIRDAAA